MLLKSLRITKLYGAFSYNIEFDSEDNFYILTGFNGYGKTTILNMLHALCHIDELYYFYEIPFERISVEFDNDTHLDITKVDLTVPADTDEQIATEDTTIFYIRRSNRLIATFQIKESDYLKSNYFRSKHDTDHFQTFSYQSSRLYQVREQGVRNPILEKFAMNLVIMHDTYIRAQRLLYDNDGEDGSPVIVDVVKKLQRQIDSSYFKFLQFSQQRDSKFIDTLLSSKSILNKDEYEERASNLNSVIQELRQFDLLPKTTIRPFDESHARELTVYLKEMELKLAQYNSIRNKLNLFLELLNNKDFVNKEIKFSRKDGFRVWLPNSNSYLEDLSRLSSGEQNEIIMLFKLIFEVPDNTLLLIDEPEISLHIAWQLQFIDDIKKISKSRKLQIIIASHSSAIVSQSLENCYDLTEMNA
jgi:predicted ATP-binding protein involved in virulence